MNDRKLYISLILLDLIVIITFMVLFKFSIFNDFIFMLLFCLNIGFIFLTYKVSIFYYQLLNDVKGSLNQHLARANAHIDNVSKDVEKSFETDIENSLNKELISNKENPISKSDSFF